MTCLLGVDIGTTNVKILAVTPHDWKIIAHTSLPLTTLSPEPGYAEQEPEAVWQAVRQGLSEVVIGAKRQQASIKALSFSAGMHSLLAVDSAGKPLTNALLWSDNRAEPQATELHTDQKALGDSIYAQTGTPIHPMIPLCKLAWFRASQPDLLKQAAKFISLKEYVWWKLTARYDIDYSMATATGLFDMEKRTWFQPALDFAGIRPGQLSEPQPTTFVVNYDPGKEGVVKTALPAGVQLFPGASDGVLANLGSGCIEPGITTITIGTSGAVRQTVHKPQRDPHGRLFCYYLDERNETPYYVVGGPTNNGANVLQWLAEKLTLQETDEVLTEADTIPVGAEDLLFLPYLYGERAPLWDASARGAYLNVDYRHTRAHFVRAALEGVMFNLLSIEKLLAKQTGPTRMIYANGGFAKSTFWVQMMANVFGVPVRLNASNESSAMGAVLLISDLTTSLEKLAGEVSFGQEFEPDPECHKRYQTVFEQWENALQKRI
ncbi:gluconokinase [Spirosoma endbachense]|uniref:Carbohydrate kinase n=1 Tax=Spirosoma endbachense TaxID=2666025 RepID=A0A6P1VX15_9BACT|nr:gluconokinase [Spirosoma endbachense]QHV95906.1 carbohydrate kinase [Spirosoma endbachense]